MYDYFCGVCLVITLTVKYLAEVIWGNCFLEECSDSVDFPVLCRSQLDIEVDGLGLFSDISSLSGKSVLSCVCSQALEVWRFSWGLTTDWINHIHPSLAVANHCVFFNFLLYPCNFCKCTAILYKVQSIFPHCLR